MVRRGQRSGYVKDGGVEGGGDDGGGGGKSPSCGSGWFLLAFTVAKMESVPIEGDRCLTGEAGVENASRLPGRNSCRRQMSPSCGDACRVPATMVVESDGGGERWWWRAMVVVESDGGGGGEGDAVMHAMHFFFWWDVGGFHGPGVPKMP